MVILAVGLLALEALGIGAARSIALAERQSGYATIASDSLESALHQLRSTPATIPTRFCVENLPHGDALSRDVDLSTPGLARVTMRVIPNGEAYGALPDTFEMSSSLFLPTVLAGSVIGQSCA
jgi:hypothetical protein